MKALAALLAASALAAPPCACAAPAANLALAHEVLRTLVGIDTVEPKGSTAAAQALAERFRAAGFAAADVQLLAPAEHPEKANLVVRLRGRGQGKPVMWDAHLDVVAADPRDWSEPPFALTEKDGFLYGRGTGDMKGEAAAMTAALIRLKQEGFRPDRDIVCAFTADEEAAGHVDGVRWLLKSHPELFDVALVLNPDAGGGASQDGRRLFYAVQTAEKAYVTFTLQTTGRGGHSSRPEGDNAIYRLAGALERLSTHRFPVRLTATTRAFLRDSSALEPEGLRRDMMALAADPADAAAAERLSARPELNALLRTTCVATLLRAGEAENALPRHAEATIQCRLLPGDDVDEVQQALAAAVADPRAKLTLAKPPHPAPETTPDPKVMAVIGKTVKGLWPDTPLVVRMDAGGSDAVFTRAAGLQTYGVSSIFSEVDDNRHHAPDERISRAAFEDGVEFTYRLMKSLSAVQSFSKGRNS
jgi:acetylornithine deacetylase/succinyl-diaminopimelate desuccinylase-like protein